MVIFHNVYNLTEHHNVGLPDLPYFTGDSTFQPLSPASQKEVAEETKFPVFDWADRLN